MNKISLLKSACIKQRIDTIKILLNKAEMKVTHADTFRQRNMNYALVIFAGLIAMRVKLTDPNDQTLKIAISITLLILSLIFCVWDRRWHKIKHGWDNTAKICYRRIVDLTNNPDQDITFSRYNVKIAKSAEWDSLQPIVFYTLVIGSIASFFI